MVLRSKTTKATTSLTFLTAMLALSGCYTPLRPSSRTDAASPDTSRVDAPSTGGPIDAATSTGVDGASAGGAAGSSVDANGLGGVGGLPLGGQGGGVGAGGAGGSLDGSALGEAGGSVEDAPISAGGTTSSGGVPGTGGSTSTQDASSTLPKGSSCAIDSQCADGHCVEGICCNDKCTGQCQACNESGSVGTCKTVQGDPRGTRAACAGSGKCKGQCDGTNADACLMPGTSTVCKDPSCAIGATTAASTCNGSGICITPAAKQCTSNLCATDGSGTCAGSCTPTSCPTGFYYDSTGNCVQKKASGSGNTCWTGAECASDHCSFEGICCSSDCTGQCQTCSNSSGTCSRVTSGQPVGGRAACAKAGTPCGGACDGSSDTACHYPGTDQSCGSASCASDNASTVTPACNGSGSCSSSATNSCGSSAYCSSGSCTPKGSGSCTNNVQCTSGNCSNNLCCASGLTNSNGVCCASGLTGCSGQCVNTNTNSAYCGSCTNSCSSDRMCLSGSCTCALGTSDCGLGGTCYSTASDPSHCGSTCKQCATSQQCSVGTCICPLGGAQSACGGCLAWDFESGTQNWALGADSSNRAKTITWSSSPVYGGSHSLSIYVEDATGLGGTVIAIVPFCSTNVSGKTLTAHARFESSSGTAFEGFEIMVMPSGTNGAYLSSSSGDPFALSHWDTWTATLPVGDASNLLTLYISLSGAYGWLGTLYLDDISIQ